MSNHDKSPDDIWFEALGGQALPDADDSDSNDARLLRAQFLQRAAIDTDDNSQAHQTEQLAKLMARLEAEGHFKEAGSVPQIVRKKSVAEWFGTDKLKWMLALATPLAVVFTGVGIMLHQNDVPQIEVMMRGNPTPQKRLVDNPGAEAAALCTQIARLKRPCRVDADGAGVTLTAIVDSTDAVVRFLHAQELLADEKGILIVRFEKR